MENLNYIQLYKFLISDTILNREELEQLKEHKSIREVEYIDNVEDYKEYSIIILDDNNKFYDKIEILVK